MLQPGGRRWVLVAGTGLPFGCPDEVIWCAEAVGAALARHGYGLVVGGWAGVDHITARTFKETLDRVAPEEPLTSRLMQVLPRGRFPDFPGGHIIVVDEGPLEWLEGLRFASAAVLIGGIGGTYETYVFATQERIPVFAIAGTGGDAERAFREIDARWREVGPWGVRHTSYMATLGQAIENPVQASEIALLLMRLLEDQFAFSDGVTAAGRTGVFFSYSHADRDWLNIVRSRFEVIPDHTATLWDNSLIAPGQFWDDEILKRLVRTRAAVLLVTHQFLFSNYIRQHELPFLLSQHRVGHLRIFWLLVERLGVAEDQMAPLNQIQAAHNLARPLAEMRPAELNAVLVSIASNVIAHLRAA